MLYHEFLQKNREIQSQLLLFLDENDHIEENYQNLINLLSDYDILQNLYELKTFLRLISNLFNNYHQTPLLKNKIERLLQYLKKDINNNFSNLQIFDIFKSNKEILLILVEQKIMIIDQSVLNRIALKKYFERGYHNFFSPEIYNLILKKENNDNENKLVDENKLNDENKINGENKSNDENVSSSDYDDYSSDDSNDDNNLSFIKLEMNFYKEQKYHKFIKMIFEKLPDNFLEQRKIGENENQICKLIRDDLIEDFIIFVNQNDFSLNSKLEQSIYETNPLLIKSNKITLIEYAAFFGSVQIFKYLYLNGVKLESSLWVYGIHGNNPELIHILEENGIKPDDKTYEKCFKEAVKCHHNDIANYILDNYIVEKKESNHLENDFNEKMVSYSFHYYNYVFFPEELDYHFIFYYACKYDHYEIVEYLLKTKNIDLSEKFVFFLIILFIMVFLLFY